MPRREHTTLQSGDLIDFLKSIGCIIYLPLAENDFQEKITGNYLQFTGNGSLTWNATKQMYLVTNPSSQGQYIATLPFSYNASDFVDNGFTRFFTFEKSSYSGNFSTISDRTTGNSPIGMMAKPGTLNINNWSSGKHSDLSVEASYRQFIEDNVQYAYSSTPADNYRPNSWANTTSTIYFGPSTASNSTNTECYISNVMLFNRALTASEIIQLYSLL